MARPWTRKSVKYFTVEYITVPVQGPHVQPARRPREEGLHRTKTQSGLPSGWYLYLSGLLCMYTRLQPAGGDLASPGGLGDGERGTDGWVG